MVRRHIFVVKAFGMQLIIHRILLIQLAHNMRQHPVSLLKMLFLQILGITSIIRDCLIAVTQGLGNLIRFTQIEAISGIHMRLQLCQIKRQRRLYVHEFLVHLHLLIRLGHDILFDILHTIAMQNMLSIIQQITFRLQLKADSCIRLFHMTIGMQLIIFLLHMIVNSLITHDDQSQRRTLHTAYTHALSA